MTDDIAHRLDTVWAPWARRADGMALGFPRETTIGRVMREGPSAGQSTARSVIPPHPEAEKLEAAVVAIGDPQLVKLVRMKHVERWWVKDLAREFSVSKPTVYAYLARCYRRIQLALGA